MICVYIPPDMFMRLESARKNAVLCSVCIRDPKWRAGQEQESEANTDPFEKAGQPCALNRPERHRRRGQGEILYGAGWS